MHHFISDVTRSHEPVVSELSLDSQIPLLNIRRFCVVLESSEHACSRIRCISVWGEWERIAPGFEPKWIVEASGGIGQLNLSAPRWTLRRCQIQLGRLHVIEDAVTGTNDHLSILHWIPN